MPGRGPWFMTTWGMRTLLMPEKKSDIFGFYVGVLLYFYTLYTVCCVGVVCMVWAHVRHQTRSRTFIFVHIRACIVVNGVIGNMGVQ